MKYDTPVSEKMTKSLVTVVPSQYLQEIRDLFDHHIFHHLPVVEDGKLVGMISRTDFEKILLGTRLAYGYQESEFKKLLSRITVGEAMTHNPFSVPPETPMGEISEVFSKERFHAIPVVEEGKLLGLITNHDVLHFFIEYDPR